jgi:hypothetical protein
VPCRPRRSYFLILSYVSIKKLDLELACSFLIVPFIGSKLQKNHKSISSLTGKNLIEPLDSNPIFPYGPVSKDTAARGKIAFSG